MVKNNEHYWFAVVKGQDVCSGVWHFGINLLRPRDVYLRQ